jgi:hypothetical protein
MNKDQLAEIEAAMEARGIADPFRSGVIPKEVLTTLCPMPSWDEVDEYLREGRHQERVEHYAAEWDDFADVLRAIRNDLEAEAEADGEREGPRSKRGVVLPFPAPR